MGSKLEISPYLFNHQYDSNNPNRVATFACPRVLDDQKMSEDNQKLRSGCPPDYQIFWEKYFENNCPYKFFKDFILTLSFFNKQFNIISFW